MKKTLFALFIVLLMFWGNMEVFANTSNSTQESDGGGTSSSSNSETEEKKEKMCAYKLNDYQIQIRYTDSEVKPALIDPKTGKIVDGYSIDIVMTYEEWIEYASQSKLGCPYSIVVSEVRVSKTPGEMPPACLNPDGTINTNATAAGCSNNTKVIGYDIIKEKKDSKDSVLYCSNCDDVDFDFIYGNTEFDCKSLIGDDMVALINSGMNIIKIIVPIIVIGLGIFDIAKAVFASNDDDIKKAQKTFFKRLIIAVIIFFSPILVNFVIDITNEAAGFVNSDTCGIK